MRITVVCQFLAISPQDLFRTTHFVHIVEKMEILFYCAINEKLNYCRHFKIRTCTENSLRRHQDSRFQAIPEIGVIWWTLWTKRNCPIEFNVCLPQQIFSKYVKGFGRWNIYMDRQDVITYSLSALGAITHIINHVENWTFYVQETSRHVLHYAVAEI